MDKEVSKEPMEVDVLVMEPSVEVKRYKVSFDLPEKYWHEDIKRYIFQPLDDLELIISEVPEVSLETSDVWRFSDLLYNGIKHVDIRRVN